LVVGMFLIYSTMSFAMVQRRAIVGTMLAIGLSRRDLLLGVLAEALAIGVLATIIGLAAGHALAQGLVDLMLRTVGDPAFAALGPAVDAARAAPAAVMQRSALERSARTRGRLAAFAALPALGAAALLLGASPRSLATAFAGLFCVLAAGALLTPAATVGLMRVL